MKESAINKVIGDISEEKKAAILKQRKDIFEKQQFKDLRELEKEKTPEELYVINLVNDVTNQVCRDLGLEDFNIAEKNVHVIKKEKWFRKESETEGFCEPLRGFVLMQERLPRIVFARNLLHEMIHMKLWNAAQMTRDATPKLRMYLSGISTTMRDGSRRVLNTINEAVIEELAIRYFPRIMSNSIFADEIRSTEDLLSQFPIAEINGVPLDVRDPEYGVYYIEPTNPQEPNMRTKTYRSLRPKERAILKLLVGKIKDGEKDAFKDRDEVFFLFARSVATGDLVPLWNVIDRIFPNGTFNKIAELDDKPEELREF